MKNIILPCFRLCCYLVLSTALISCNTDKIKQGKELIEIGSEAYQANENSTDHLEALKNTTPLTPSAIAGWFPKDLADMELDRTDKSSATEVNSATAYYLGEGTINMNISISDFAGEQGYGMLSGYAMLKFLSENEEDEAYFERSIEGEEIYGVEYYNKSSEAYTMAIICHDRFLLKLMSYKTDPAMVREAVESLDLKALMAN